jgi:SOS-response transcriptional repressor LexA
MTPKQKQLHDYLWSKRDEPTPSYVEMAEHLGLSSKSGVARMIDVLAEQGMVVKSKNLRARSLVVNPPRNALSSVSTSMLISELSRRGYDAIRATEVPNHVG